MKDSPRHNVGSVADPHYVVDEEHYLKAVADADHFFLLSGKYLERANEAEAQRDRLAEALKELDLTGIKYQEKPVDAVGRMRGIAKAALAEIAALKAKDLTKFEPDWANYRVGFDCGFAEAQEQAAKVCDEYAEAGVTGALMLAAAIRAMKVEK